jgi:hypothetical protein
MGGAFGVVHRTRMALRACSGIGGRCGQDDVAIHSAIDACARFQTAR